VASLTHNRSFEGGCVPALFFSYLITAIIKITTNAMAKAVPAKKRPPGRTLIRSWKRRAVLLTVLQHDVKRAVMQNFDQS
jgi:hypothetical protein